MSYGHAAAVLAADGRRSPVPELEAAVARLKAWADVNPPLKDLHQDFGSCLRDVARFVRESGKAAGCCCGTKTGTETGRTP